MPTAHRTLDHANRLPLHAWAAAGLLLAFTTVAHAYPDHYTVVIAEQGLMESLSGAPLAQSSAAASASAQANGVSLQVSDSTHWTGGPYASAGAHHRFGVAGDAGTYETLSFTIAVVSHFGNDLAADFVASHGFSVEVAGNGVPLVGAGAGLNEVNCIGCGGHIILSSVSGSQGPSGEWGNDFAYTYTFTTQVERGLHQAGYLGMSGYLGVGSTWANLSIQLLSMIDGEGRALTWGADGFVQPVAVPVSAPGTVALCLVGAAALGSVARRRRVRPAAG